MAKIKEEIDEVVKNNGNTSVSIRWRVEGGATYDNDVEIAERPYARVRSEVYRRLRAAMKAVMEYHGIDYLVVSSDIKTA